MTVCKILSLVTQKQKSADFVRCITESETVKHPRLLLTLRLLRFPLLLIAENLMNIFYLSIILNSSVLISPH